MFLRKTVIAVDSKMDSFISTLLVEMTLEEKIGQLTLVTSILPVYPDVIEKIRNGSVGGLFGGLVDNSFAISGPGQLREIQELAVKQSRLGIPLLFGYDVIHGHQTVFPIPLGLSCSWNVRHAETVARIGALEATANGLNWVFSPMVDLGVDPRWGRIAEGSGEDPYLGSRFAEAMVRGYQGNDLSRPDTVLACVKHFIAYSGADGGRDYNSVNISPIDLYTYYLPPFLASVNAGVGSVMNSFSAINGIPSHADAKMNRILIKAGFSGLFVSDYNAHGEMINHGIGDAYGQRSADPLQTMSALALKAGVHMDMMSWGSLKSLAQSLAEGKVTQDEIDNACRVVLETKYKLGLFEDPYRYFNEETAPQRVLTQAYRDAAREVAADSCVLLKNDGNVLPLARTSGQTIAVIGPLADDTKNILGPWSFGGDISNNISVLQGIKDVAGAGVTVLHAKGANISDDPKEVEVLNFAGPKVEIDPRSPDSMIAEALAVAQKSDIIVAVVGEAAEMSGESASRVDIGVPENQQRLLKALAETGKPVVLVLMNGRPLTLSWENKNFPAILETWFGGIESGHAIADLLYGDRNPSGKLTTSFLRHVGQVPLRYSHLRTGRPNNDGDFSKYSTNCYFGSAKTPLFPFGHGLSYTTFSYGDITANKTELQGKDKLCVSVTVTNTGNRAGQETVQMYITDPVASICQPVRLLKGFEKISLQPGEQRIVDFVITQEALKFYDTRLRHIWESGEFVIGIGPNSDDLKTLSVNWLKDPAKPTRQRRRGSVPKLEMATG
jgi:beta-glucosidase